MAPSLFARAAFAAGLLATTTSAAYDGAAKTNVAMYWGQGSNQIPLLEVCTDPNIDIVNIGFVNKFPKKRGEYPGTNHANACGDLTYTDPTTNQPSALLSSCPGVGEAIKACKRRGKKVLLSLGGGWPVDYYLPSPDVANWFAEFLIGAYGPLTEEWKAAGKPRPFGDAVIDGFDLDLEAADYEMPSPEYLYKNYDVFGKYVKAHSNMLLSGAPQCVVPDARIFQALKEVPFDFLFTQFYNTWTCSAAKAAQDIKSKAASTFTFNSWVSWIKANSKNPNLKLYLGMAAGPDGLPTHKDHYLTPEDANLLIETYKKDSLFGGVMLWEATVSKRNLIYDQPYGTWMKYAVQGTFKQNYHPVVSSSVISSSVLPSSTPVSSIHSSSSIQISSSVLPSSTPASSTKVTPSVAPSSYPASSIQTSSSVLPSSYPSSSIEVSSSVKPSEYPASSSVVPSSTPEVYPSSSVAPSSTPEVYPSSSGVPVSASEIISSSSVVPSNSEISTSCTTSSGAYPTGAGSSSDVYPVTTPEASSSQLYPSEKSSVESPVYPTESSKGYGEYPVASSTGYDSVPSVTKKPEHSAYPTVPAGSTTSVVTTTYVDVCPTGLTTVTTTYVATVCTKCTKPTGTSDVPEGWTTSVYTASTVTVTITKPIATATGVSVYPSAAPSVAYPAEHPAVPSVAYPAEHPAAPSVAYPAEYPASPMPSGKPAYPAVPEASKAAYPVAPAYPTAPQVSKAAYPAVPEVSKAAYPVAPEHPAYPAVPSAAYPVSSSPAAEYPSQPVGDYPKKPVEHVTLSKVSIPAYTPAPYPSAGVPHVPAGPAKNATSVYVPMPTGTGASKPTMPSAYVPSEFEGAASRAGVGFMMLVGAVGAVLVM
ncbi:glycoside hydrolase family 18 protein [Curvularia clavata]|uniref:chitinase n=1 Tax=Curvularia clavata TaxID=95742 RepID=A0A9Q9DX27_CURCL|nr:glycoside hydrolase family 18 protein [Curvularia clavata]